MLWRMTSQCWLIMWDFRNNSPTSSAQMTHLRSASSVSTNVSTQFSTSLSIWIPSNECRKNSWSSCKFSLGELFLHFEHCKGFSGSNTNQLVLFSSFSIVLNDFASVTTSSPLTEITSSKSKSSKSGSVSSSGADSWSESFSSASISFKISTFRFFAIGSTDLKTSVWSNVSCSSTWSVIERSFRTTWTDSKLLHWLKKSSTWVIIIFLCRLICFSTFLLNMKNWTTWSLQVSHTKFDWRSCDV